MNLFTMEICGISYKLVTCINTSPRNIDDNTRPGTASLFSDAASTMIAALKICAKRSHTLTYCSRYCAGFCLALTTQLAPESFRGILLSRLQKQMPNLSYRGLTAVSGGVLGDALVVFA
jgi:hypothetical protein